MCGKNGSSDRLEFHHVYPGPLRGLSTKYHAGVYLCGETCHRTGRFAVHRCKQTRERLQDWMQRKLMRENNWSEEDFRKIFGKSYLKEEYDNAEPHRADRETY